MFPELFTQNCSVTMGKKMGMNSKAVAAKERKNDKAAAEKAAKDAALEDAKWKDDGNPLAKKQVGGLII